MIPRWFERSSVLILLVLAVWLRVYNLPHLPLGFSDDELASMDISHRIQDGEMRVFYAAPPNGGQESLYHILNVGSTSLFGDGLLGFRVLGLFVNLLALAFIYRSTRSLFGAGIGLVALAIMTTGIWSMILSRTATPLTLVSLFVTSTLATIVWTYRLHEPISPAAPRTLPYTLLGFLIGASIYTHYTGLLLSLVLLVFVIYLWQSNQPVSRQVWSSSFFALTLILIVALPYLISVLRNIDRTSLYGLWQERHHDVLSGLKSLGKTIGLFLFKGDSNPTRNVPDLPLMSPFWALLSVVGLVFAARRWREPAYALLLITLGVGLLPIIWIEEPLDFSSMLLIQPVLFILAGLGTYYAAQVIQQYRVMGGWRFVAVLAAVIFAYTVWQAYQRYMVDWQERDDVHVAYHSDVAQLAVYLDGNRHEFPILFCVDSISETRLPDGRIRWSEADIAEYMMFHEDHDLRYAVCRSSFVLVGGGASMRVLLAHPRSINESSATVRVWLDQLEPIPVEGLPNGAVSELAVVDEVAELGGRLQATSPLLYPLGEGSTVSLPVRFGRNITLMGYELPDTQTFKAGDVLAVTTYWRVDGEPPVNWGIFVRLQGTEQSIPVTETNVLDIIPDNLRERDVIIQTNFMTIPDTLLSGDYILTLGAYDNNPLNQIPVFEEEASIERGDYLIVEPRITVE
jgi:4-amino-4-deoxy-L-arabinose transferase-like glycosyltransferase